jgi:hypothetical protein
VIEHKKSGLRRFFIDHKRTISYLSSARLLIAGPLAWNG